MTILADSPQKRFFGDPTVRSVIAAAREQAHADRELRRGLAFTAPGVTQGQVAVGQTSTILGFVRSVTGIQAPSPRLVGVALNAYLDARMEVVA